MTSSASRIPPSTGAAIGRRISAPAPEAHSIGSRLSTMKPAGGVPLPEAAGHPELETARVVLPDAEPPHPEGSGGHAARGSRRCSGNWRAHEQEGSGHHAYSNSTRDHERPSACELRPAPTPPAAPSYRPPRVRPHALRNAAASKRHPRALLKIGVSPAYAVRRNCRVGPDQRASSAPPGHGTALLLAKRWSVRKTLCFRGSLWLAETRLGENLREAFPHDSCARREPGWILASESDRAGARID